MHCTGIYTYMYVCVHAHVCLCVLEHNRNNKCINLKILIIVITIKQLWCINHHYIAPLVPYRIMQFNPVFCLGVNKLPIQKKFCGWL